LNFDLVCVLLLPLIFGSMSSLIAVVVVLFGCVVFQSAADGNPRHQSERQHHYRARTRNGCTTNPWPQNTQDPSKLLAGAKLPNNQRNAILSPSINVQAVMQCDGNLVVYCEMEGYAPNAVWSTKTDGNPGAYLTLQSDGNLVIYTADGKKSLWASNTNGTPCPSAAYLQMQDDGNLVLSNCNGPIWASGSDGDCVPNIFNTFSWG